MAQLESPARVGSFLKALRRLRDQRSEMTILQAMFLMAIANRPGISQRELYAELEASDSAASRILALLSDLGDRRSPGLDLIRIKTNPNDRRERLLYLKPKGQQLIDDMSAHF